MNPICRLTFSNWQTSRYLHYITDWKGEFRYCIVHTTHESVRADVDDGKRSASQAEIREEAYSENNVEESDCGEDGSEDFEEEVTEDEDNEKASENAQVCETPIREGKKRKYEVGESGHDDAEIDNSQLSERSTLTSESQRPDNFYSSHKKIRL